jgi:hypothetical protein
VQSRCPELRLGLRIRTVDRELDRRCHGSSGPWLRSVGVRRPVVLKAHDRCPTGSFNKAHVLPAWTYGIQQIQLSSGSVGADNNS